MSVEHLITKAWAMKMASVPSARFFRIWLPYFFVCSFYEDISKPEIYNHVSRYSLMAESTSKLTQRVRCYMEKGKGVKFHLKWAIEVAAWGDTGSEPSKRKHFKVVQRKKKLMPVQLFMERNATSFCKVLVGLQIHARAHSC